MSRSLLIRVVLFLIVLAILAIAYDWTTRLDENAQLVWRIPIFLCGGIVVGIMVAVFFFPAISERVAGFFYMPAEKVEPDAGSRARALVAQGHYEEALEAYLDLAEAMPTDRLPVVEAMRLARERLEDTPRAMEIIEHAMTSRSWPEEDEAYYLFRLVEMRDEDLEDREGAVRGLVEIMNRFPETRHSANATHKLREWGLDPADYESEA